MPTSKLVLVLITVLFSQQLRAQTNVIQNHDNIVRAGDLNGNALTLNLTVDTGMWYPGGLDKPGAKMRAFGEIGGDLQAPGPMIRVTQGTTVQATVRNMLPDRGLYMHGFVSRPGDENDGSLIPPGETAQFNFELNTPGVYYYWADSLGSDMTNHGGPNALLSGALVVDPLQGSIPGKIFVIGEGSSIPGKREHSFNGRSFPNTERIEVELGELSTWHFINTTFADHPLHLHGTFFGVTHRGSIAHYAGIEDSQIVEEVTASVAAGEVMTMAWSTERPGNWLFHCHISAHVAADSGRLSSGDNFEVDADAPGLHEMGGMTLAITAAPGSEIINEPSPAREITMSLESVPSSTSQELNYGVAFEESNTTSLAPIAPGPLLVLQENQPTSINIENSLPETTSIHWHGMELQSYYDGVAGYSGTGSSVTPAIASGANFVARMTPPRAGTYIYHTHMDDRNQLIRGLYGALIVSSPSYPYDPAIDKVFVLGLADDAIKLGPRAEGLVINGSKKLTMELSGTQEFRLRLINITANNSEFEISLVGRDRPQQWHLIGKDGAQLPAQQQLRSEAIRQPVSVGETYDFAWTPPATGVYWLEVRRRNGEWMGQAQLNVVNE